MLFTLFLSFVLQYYKRGLKVEEKDKESYGKVTSFRIPSALHTEFKRKAKQQGRSMNEVVRDLIKAYVGLSTPIDELKKEKSEIETKISELEAKKSEIEKEIENQKGEIPDQVIEYLRGPFQDQRTEIQDKRIREFSGKLDMTPEEFVKKAKQEIDDFNGGGRI